MIFSVAENSSSFFSSENFSLLIYVRLPSICGQILTSICKKIYCENICIHIKSAIPKRIYINANFTVQLLTGGKIFSINYNLECFRFLPNYCFPITPKVSDLQFCICCVETQHLKTNVWWNKLALPGKSLVRSVE